MGDFFLLVKLLVLIYTLHKFMPPTTFPLADYKERFPDRLHDLKGRGLINLSVSPRVAGLEERGSPLFPPSHQGSSGFNWPQHPLGNDPVSVKVLWPIGDVFSSICDLYWKCHSCLTKLPYSRLAILPSPAIDWKIWKALYLCGCSFGCTSRWQQLWCYSSLWRCSLSVSVMYWTGLDWTLAPWWTFLTPC